LVWWLTEDVVRAKLTFADNVIKVEAKSPNGTFSGEVVCKYEGEPFARDYWAAKLVQVLKQIGAENIRISSVTGEHGALIINDSSKVFTANCTISAGQVADTPPTTITADMVGQTYGGRKGYRMLRCTAAKVKP